MRCRATPSTRFAPGGVVETVLEANPGLSELGVILPHGTAIELPETDSAARTETVNLWD